METEGKIFPTASKPHPHYPLDSLNFLNLYVVTATADDDYL